MRKLFFLLSVMAIAACMLAGCIFSGVEDNKPDNTNGGNTQTSVTDNDTPAPAVTVFKAAGTYQIGTDIPAGEYLLVTTGSLGGYLEVKLTRDAGVLSSDFLYNENFSSRRYVAVNSGEWLTFNRANLYKLDSAPQLNKDADKGYPAGQFKAGRDIAAGEYLIVDPTFNSNYLEQLLVPNASPTSSDFLFNQIFSYRHYVRVSNGQYISFNRGKLYEVNEAPAIVTNPNGQLRAGQYKAGTDIQAGQHRIVVTQGTSAYYEIKTLPLASILSDDFITNGNVSANTLITVAAGQYLFINSGSLQLNQ